MSDLGDWQTIALNLAGIVALIVLLGWVVRRVPGIVGRAQGSMRVISSLPLGQRERLVLVVAGERQLLLGVAQGSIRLLKDEPAKAQVVPFSPAEEREAV